MDQRGELYYFSISQITSAKRSYIYIVRKKMQTSYSKVCCTGSLDVNDSLQPTCPSLRLLEERGEEWNGWEVCYEPAELAHTMTHPFLLMLPVLHHHSCHVHL